MEKGERVISVAKKEIGYCETPAGTNKTKYGKWFGLDGVAWCGMFVSWCFAQAGYALGNIGYLKGFAGCQSAYAFFKKNNMIISFEDAQPGDIVLCDWNGDGRFDHACIFVSKKDNNLINTIEGNTSATNQSNGGQVQERIRDKKFCVFVRPTYKQQ